MVFDLVDKEGTKSGKGLGWSWFGLNDGKRDAKILRELGEIYKGNSVAAGVFDKKIKGLTVSSRENAKEIKKNNIETADLSKGFLDAAASADKMTISARAATFGMQALKVAANMGIALVASAALNFVIEQITHLVNAQKEAIAAAKEMSDAYAEQRDKINGNINTLKGLQDEFGKLSKGVDDYGNNVSLSADEYSRYQSIVEQIVAISPSLITGYNDEGKAIADKNGLIESSIALEKEKLRLEREGITTPDNLWKVAKGDIATYQKKEQELRDHQETLKSIIREMTDGGFWDNNPNADNKNDFIANVLGIDTENVSQRGELLSGYSNVIIENIDKIYAEASKSVGIFEEEDLQSFKNYIDEKNRLTKSLNSQSTFVNSLLQQVPQTLTAYDTLTDAQKSFVTNYINGQKITPDLINNKDAMTEIRQNILDLTQDIADNTIVKDGINRLFSLDRSKIPYGEWKAQAELLINTIADALGLTGDDRKDFIINLGFKTDELDPYINEMVQQFSISEDAAKKLKTEMKEAADEYNNLTNGNVDYNKRPVKTPEEMLKYGYDIGDSDGATTFTSGHGFLRDKVEFEVEMTPILDNGHVLTEKELNNYFDKICSAAKTSLDVINNDKPENGGLGLVVHIGKDPKELAQLEDDLEEVKDKHLNAWMKLNKTGYTKEQIESLTDEEIRLLYKIENKGDMTFGEAKDEIKKLQDQAIRTAESLEAFAQITATLEDVTKASQEAIDNLQSSAKTLTETINALNEGESLSGSELIDLIQKYPSLTQEIQKTETGYRLNVEALNALRETELQATKDSLKAQIKHTKCVIDSTMSNISAYGLQINAIKSLADAEAALAGNKTGLYGLDVNKFDFEKNTYNGSSLDWLSEEGIATLKSKVQSSLAVLEIGKLQDQLNLLDKMDYTTFSKKSKSKKNAVSEAYKAKYEEIKHLRAMDLIDDKEYGKRLDALDQEYLANRSKYIGDHRSALEELKSLKETIYQEMVSDIDDIISYNAERDWGEGSIGNYTTESEAVQAQMQLLDNFYNNDKISYKFYTNKKEELLLKFYSSEKNVIEQTKKRWTDAIDSEIDKLNERKSALSEQEELYSNALSAITSAIEKRKEALQEERDAEEKYWDDRLEELEKEQKETTKQIELDTLLQNLRKAEQTNVMVYHKGEGFVWEQDVKALQDAQKAMDDFNRTENFEDARNAIEDQKEEALNAIDAMIDRWDDYLDKWNDVANAYAEMQNADAAAQIFGDKWNSDVILKNVGEINQFKESFISIQSSISDIEDSVTLLEKQKEAVEKSADAQIEKLKALKLTWKDALDIKNFSNEYVVSLTNLASAEQGNYAFRITSLRSFVDEYNNLITSMMKPQDAENSAVDVPTWMGKEATDAQLKAWDKDWEYVGNGSWLHKKTGSVTDGGYHAYANGTTYAEGGLSLVGENGPELRVIPKGNGIIPSDMTKRLLALVDGKHFPSMEDMLHSGNLPSIPSIKSRMSPSNTSFLEIEPQIRKQNSVSFTGDIHVTGVQEPEQLSDAIIKKLPNLMMQKIFQK